LEFAINRKKDADEKGGINREKGTFGWGSSRI